ncbi:hypothetical protein BaRGS_00009596 [Batillaria attramentaria]|uniref:Uncharacterized protein n=1 Tax=Batillaria attramentaria TaxID=370345 RepID=A0ABD0LHU3_9CAEN
MATNTDMKHPAGFARLTHAVAVGSARSRDKLRKRGLNPSAGTGAGTKDSASTTTDRQKNIHLDAAFKN